MYRPGEHRSSPFFGLLRLSGTRSAPPIHSTHRKLCHSLTCSLCVYGLLCRPLLPFASTPTNTPWSIWPSLVSSTTTRAQPFPSHFTLFYDKICAMPYQRKYTTLYTQSTRHVLHIHECCCYMCVQCTLRISYCTSDVVQAKGNLWQAKRNAHTHTRSGTKIAHTMHEKRSRRNYTEMEANDSYIYGSECYACWCLCFGVYASIWIRRICVWSSRHRRHSRHRRYVSASSSSTHNTKHFY